MNTSIQCDLAIIGAGSSGLSLASMASQLGWSVVLIEAGEMGGDCLNYGCVPSKAFLAASKKIESQNTKQKARQQQCFEEVMEHVQSVIQTIAPHDSEERFRALGVNVIREKAAFISPRQIKAGNTIIQAARFAIATGSTPLIPPIPGINDVVYHTNETIFSLEECPEHLLIIGGGPIGCELAQGFSRLGIKVSLIEASHILNKDDPEAVEQVRQALKKNNIDIYEQSKVIHVSPGLEIRCETPEGEQTLKGSHLLIASGRKPHLDELQLDKAKVNYHPQGIEVNARQQTSNKKIYALGDVTGPYPFTHMAEYQAGIVLKNLVFGLPAKVDYSAVPWVTYTRPELAHVGQPTHQALSGQTLSHYCLSENDRAQAEDKTKGFIKVLADRKGRVLGVTIVADGAGELLMPWIMAIREKKTLRSFTDLIVPYPTLSEISKRVAGEFYRPKLFSPQVKKIVAWLKHLRRIK